MRASYDRKTSLVDEIIFCFTHDIVIDWMLPGVAPTGRYVEVPLVVIVSFDGDKLLSEHIYWDQASVLVQIGLLSAETLPVIGNKSAKKVLNKTLPSNQLSERALQSVRHEFV
jgi:carboxymethylenebutenolidase